MKKLEVIKAQQITHKLIYTSVIKFTDLRDIVNFTNRVPNENAFSESFDMAQHQLFKDNSESNYYQRIKNTDRTKEISKFILKQILNSTKPDLTTVGVFPTSVIIAFNQRESDDDSIGIKINENNEIEVNDDTKGLIVDGQHRIAGLIELYDQAKKNLLKNGKVLLDSQTCRLVIESLESFSFICTILVDFDLYEQSEIFINVNFNQKPVNKSFYYDVFGELNDKEKNELYLIHNLVLHLNNYKDSPLKGFIKMLGTGEGYFSQAFLVEALLPLFNTKQDIWSHLLVDMKSDNSNKDYQFLATFYIAYFNALKNDFLSYWPVISNKYNFVLLKTNGLGALVKLSGDIKKDLASKYPRYSEFSRENLMKIFSEKYFVKIKERSEELFGTTSNFTGGGSKARQMALYKELKHTIFS